MRTIPFNINWNMRVKLDEKGLAELRRRHDELRKLSPSIGEFSPRIDEEGYYLDQAWSIMADLGHLCSIGLATPFATEVLLEIEGEPAQRTVNRLRERLKGLQEACYASDRTLNPTNIAMLCDDVLNMLTKLHV